MKVPDRVIGSISRRLQSSLRVYEEHLTPAHRKLFGPLVLGVLKATSCHVAKAARELPELGARRQVPELRPQPQARSRSSQARAHRPARPGLQARAASAHLRRPLGHLEALCQEDGRARHRPGPFRSRDEEAPGLLAQRGLREHLREVARPGRVRALLDEGGGLQESERADPGRDGIGVRGHRGPRNVDLRLRLRRQEVFFPGSWTEDAPS